MLLSLLQVSVSLITTIASLGLAIYFNQESSYARALTFVTLVAGILGLIFVNRSWSRSVISTLRSPNSALWWVVGAAIVFLALVLYLPYLREVFQFSWHFTPSRFGGVLGGGNT